MYNNIKIIGMGGTGTHLVELLSRYLNYLNSSVPYNILIIDGKSFEERKKDRQVFEILGNKAHSKCSELSNKFPKITFNFYPKYINEKNIETLIHEKDLVFVCVDNHKSRRLISKYCETLDNVVVIFGGNDIIDGNIQLYLKIDGTEINNPITTFHPEIENPEGKSPEEMSCEELQISEPQLLFTNAMVALVMCCIYYNLMITDMDFNVTEVNFDISKLKMVPSLYLK